MSRRKLTMEQVREVRETYLNSGSKYVMRELAEKYGVSYRTIWNMVRGNSYPDDNYKPTFIYNYSGEDCHRSTLTLEQVKEIRETYIPNHRVFGGAALARKFGVGTTAIYKVVHGETWREN